MPKGQGYGKMPKMMKKGTKSGMSPKMGKAGQTKEMKKSRMGLSSMTTSGKKMMGKKMKK